jgi:large-conductance mechanosensitive channel
MDKNNILISELNEFYKFMIDNEILQIGLAFVISHQVINLFKVFIEDIVSPILAKLINSKEYRIENINIDIFGINLRIGNFFMHLLQITIVLIIIFYLIRLLPKNAVSNLSGLLQNQ